MTTIETMFARWRSQYAEWVLAELELQQARQRGRGRLAVALLEARVRHLQQQCSAALDETSAALSTGRAHQSHEQAAQA